MNKIKTMKLRTPNRLPEVTPEVKVYKQFDMFGRTFCIAQSWSGCTNSARKNSYSCSEYTTGMSICESGHKDVGCTIKEVLNAGTTQLELIGETRLLEATTNAEAQYGVLNP